MFQESAMHPFATLVPYAIQRPNNPIADTDARLAMTVAALLPLVLPLSSRSCPNGRAEERVKIASRSVRLQPDATENR